MWLRAGERAWHLGVCPERIVIDIDATLVDAHTEKEGAAVNYRSGFAFHPLLSYLDETHEALAGVLRGGGAPAHSAQAQLDVLDMALAQLPVEVVSDLDTEIVMRIDSAGAAGCALARPPKTRNRVPGRVRSVHRRPRIDPAIARGRLASGDPPGRAGNARARRSPRSPMSSAWISPPVLTGCE